jgi:hypothetical protein
MEAFHALAATLNRAGVQYLLIGVAGANYWARRGSEAFVTQDRDLFCQPSPTMCYARGAPANRPASRSRPGRNRSICHATEPLINISVAASGGTDVFGLGGTGVIVVWYCIVSLKDVEGITHSVRVQASSLLEAASHAVRAFRQQSWAAEALTPAAVLRVEVHLPPIVHEVPLKAVERWLRSPSASPREASTKHRAST